MFARFVCVVSLLTGTAVPTTVLTVFTVHQMPLFTFFAEPSRTARFICSVRFGTAGTEPHFLCVIPLFLLAIQSTVRVLRSARRTTPGIFTECIVGGMNRVANGARPAPVRASRQQLLTLPPPLLREMDAIACLAPPGGLRNAELIRFCSVRANRLFVFHIAYRAMPFGVHIRNGKTDGDHRRRKPL